MARVLVTGGTGFLGAHVVADLRTAGHQAIPAGRRLAEAVHSVDLRDEASVAQLVDDVRPDTIIHCAAYGVAQGDNDFDTSVKVNVGGSLSLLEAAISCGVERFVQVGSCFEYGSKGHDIAEDEALMPTAAYGATKAAATLLTRQRAASSDTRLVVARPFGLWGPGEPHGRLVPQIIAACRANRPLDLTPCDVVRDYSYVADMARSLVKLAFADYRPGEIVNLGSGVAVVLRDFVLEVSTLLGGAHLMRFGAIGHRPTEMKRLVANVSRQRALVGDPPSTPIDVGLRAMQQELLS
jgi:nucleoside-diphosphate-sugar epimerase